MLQIKNLRKQAGKSQVELARSLSVTQSSVAKWETGEAYPRCELIPQIADTLGCTIDELYGRSESDSCEENESPE